MSSRDAAGMAGPGDGGPGDGGPGDGARPVLRVIHGAATDDEIAALLAALGVLSARAAGPEPSVPASASAWNDRAAAVRAPLLAGPGAWRAAGRRR